MGLGCRWKPGTDIGPRFFFRELKKQSVVYNVGYENFD